MNFEQPVNTENSYEKLSELSIEDLEQQVNGLTLDQLTWLKAKFESDLEKVEKDKANPELKHYSEMMSDQTKEPIKGELGLTLDELTLQTAQFKRKMEIVQAASEKIDYKE